MNTIEAQKFHGERVEERQRVNGQPNGYKPISEAELRGDSVDDASPISARTATLMAVSDGPQPPFMEFWLRQNELRKRQGLDDLNYGDARSQFFGGPPPKGALTFVDSRVGEGLRAVPDGSYDGAAVYRGEYREVTHMGTLWHKARNLNGEIIAYRTAEAALEGARVLRDELIDKKFR